MNDMSMLAYTWQMEGTKRQRIGQTKEAAPDKYDETIRNGVQGIFK